jgi:hypothetical protein
LEEKLCREGTKDRVVEYSVELCQVGIEQGARSAQENSVSSSERRVSRRRHYRVFEHSVSSARSALSRCKECTEPTRSEVLEEIEENQSC